MAVDVCGAIRTGRVRYFAPLLIAPIHSSHGMRNNLRTCHVGEEICPACRKPLSIVRHGSVRSAIGAIHRNLLSFLLAFPGNRNDNITRACGIDNLDENNVCNENVGWVSTHRSRQRERIAEPNKQMELGGLK